MDYKTKSRLLALVGHLPAIRKLADEGYLFACNHSAGKDSQIMYLILRAIVPDDQIAVFHAPLEGADWPDLDEHMAATVEKCHPVILAAATKTFEEMVIGQGYWPTPQYRQCTSDLKRGPLEREIKRYLKRNPRFGGKVVSCQGLRAEESTARKKLPTLKSHAKNSTAGRTWLDWLPIHKFLIGDVWAGIKAANQKPHWAYAAGMSRLSCRFCIMSNKADLTTAARENPEMYARYVALEHRLGTEGKPQTFCMPSKSKGARTLDQITGVPVNPIIFDAELARLRGIKTPIKTKIVKGEKAYYGGSLRTLLNWNGHAVLYVQKNHLESWVLTPGLIPNHGDTVPADGQRYFRTLRDLTDALNTHDTN